MSAGYTKGLNRSTALTTPWANQSGAQVQNVKSARVYVFGDADVYEDEVNTNVEVEMSEIRSRRGQAGRQTTIHTAPEEPSFFEREITEGDTLQSLALQYACPVSELKRINNLIRDQDFYALRVLKVPIKRHGFLSEIIEQEKQNASKKKTRPNHETTRPSDSDTVFVDDTGDTDSCHDFSDPDTQMKVIHTLSIRDHMSQQGREAEDFLRSMDKDLKHIRDSSRTDRGSLDEVISALTNRTIYPLHTRKVKHLNDADCGIRWWSILVVTAAVIIIGIILSVVYFLYYRKS